jgi:hypothetical protein
MFSDVNAWPTVVAGLGGTIVGGLAAWFIEFSRYRRQRRECFLDQRRDLSARFLAAADVVSSYAEAVHFQGIAKEELIEELNRAADDAVNEMYRLYSNMELVSTKTERDAALQVAEAARDYMSGATGWDDTPLPKLRSALSDAREAFLTAARSELAPSSS